MSWPCAARTPGARRHLAALTLLAAAAVGCGSGEPASWDGSRSLLSSRAVLDPPPPAPRAQRTTQPDPGCTQVRSMVGDFRRGLQTRRPPDAVLETMLGCLEQDGRWSEEFALLGEAVAAFPEDRALRLKLATARFQFGDEGEALRQVAEVRRLAPDDPDALFLAGLIQSRTPGQEPARLQQARQAWSRLVELAPATPLLGRIPLDEVRRQLTALEQRLAATPRAPAGSPGDPDNEAGDEQPQQGPPASEPPAR